MHRGEHMLLVITAYTIPQNEHCERFIVHINMQDTRNLRKRGLLPIETEWGLINIQKRHDYG